MHTMTRHVLSELTKVFAFALGVLTVIVMLVFVGQKLIKEGLPVLQVGWLFPYLLPFALCIAIPVTLLLATVTVYSRMAGFNEIVALKALGISPLAVVWPTLVMAFLLSLVTVWLNDLAAYWGRLGVQRVLVRAVEEIAYGMLRTERQFEYSSNVTINVKRVRMEDRTLLHPFVTIKGHGSTPKITIEADEATLRADFDVKIFFVHLHNCIIEADGTRVRELDHLLEIPLDDDALSGQGESTPSGLALRRIPGEIAKQIEAIERHKEESAAAAAGQLFSGEFDRLAWPEWDRRVAEAAALDKQLCRLRLEPFRRWSAGFSCFCFVWVGIPMAAWRRNRDFLTSFFLCFLPILIVYYPLLAYGIDGAKNGTIPPIAVWAGNAMLVVWGTWLMRKVMRY
jgi:lipopolysaccharide export system permease protein